MAKLIDIDGLARFMEDLLGAPSTDELGNILMTVDGKLARVAPETFKQLIFENVITLDDVAWGTPIRQYVQTGTDWGFVGNDTLRQEWLASMGRYLMSKDGSLAAKLDVNDSTVFADGSTPDFTANHVMVRCPKTYVLIKYNELTNIPTVWFSTLPISDIVIEESWLGAFQTEIDSDGRAWSRYGTVPTRNKTIQQYWNAAQVNGQDFGLEGYDHRRLMWWRLLSEFGDTYSKKCVGNGLGGSTNVTDFYLETNELPTGATMSLGDNSGNIPYEAVSYSPTDSCHVSLGGIENGWGMDSEKVQGIYCGSASNAPDQDGTEIFIYNGNRMPTATELATHPDGEEGVDWRRITRHQTEETWQYVQEMDLGKHFDIFILVSGGGSSQYWGTRQYGSLEGQVVHFGYHASYGAYASLGCVYLHNVWSYAGTGRGSRLAYYGTPKIVSGAEFNEATAV